jgi:(2R)-3-sulfolactate dehydrogenase (NADP+)
MPDAVSLPLDDAFELARAACIGAGASPAMAVSLARATVSAEARGQRSVGFAHLFDYLDALDAGRIDGTASPILTSPAPALLMCDVGGGIAQLGFDVAVDDLCRRAHDYGIALFALSGSYTTGELGWYARRVADTGLAALAATNGPALMKPAGARAPVYCTNPIAFAVPGRQGAALVIDQASSATAFVALRKAAQAGRAIPVGWAVDAAGHPTTDPHEALRGALLTFGGSRGGNIALMVEVLAAGLTRAQWSLDAPSFLSGTANPGAGLLLIAMSPALLDPDFKNRVESQVARLSDLGVYIPGRGPLDVQAKAEQDGLRLPGSLVVDLQRWANRRT